MPWTGSEIAEVSVGNPMFMTRVGNYLVCVDGGRTTPAGTLPLSGTFSVMNMSTGQAFVYTGLPTTVHATANRCRLVSEGGYAWFSSGNNLYRITPSTGSCIMVGAPGITVVALATLPGRVVCIAGAAAFAIWDISAGSFSNSANVVSGSPNTAVGVAPDRIVLMFNGSAGTSILDDNASVIASPSGGTTGTKGAGFAQGTKAYIATTAQHYMVVDVAALSVNSTLTGVSNLFAGGNIAPGDDGWFYCYRATDDSINAISMVTGAIDTHVLPTVRTRRAVAGAGPGGTWWVPSGDPLT